MMAQTKPDDETRRQMAKNMIENARALHIPPSGFNPLTATNRELVDYGLPPRPDQTKLPKLSAQWEKALSNPLSFFVPHLTVSDRPLRPLDKETLTRTAWSGAVVLKPDDVAAPIRMVSAIWTVPLASPPPEATQNGNLSDGHWTSVSWVGIDGLNNDPNISNDNHVIQAGTLSEVFVFGGIMSQRQSLWLEWFPAAPITLTTLNAGDSVTVAVCVLDQNDPTHATVSVTIQTTGKTYATSMSFASPGNDSSGASTSFRGVSAEWITEDPHITNTVLEPFPNYGTVTFTYCSASDSVSKTYDLSDADSINLILPDNTVVSTATIESSSTLKTAYTG